MSQLSMTLQCTVNQLGLKSVSLGLCNQNNKDTIFIRSSEMIGPQKPNVPRSFQSTPQDSFICKGKFSLGVSHLLTSHLQALPWEKYVDIFLQIQIEESQGEIAHLGLFAYIQPPLEQDVDLGASTTVWLGIFIFQSFSYLRKPSH